MNSRVYPAVVAILAMDAGAAMAAAPLDITTVPAANVLYVSGSTSLDPGLTSYFITGATAPCSSAAADPSPSLYVGTLAQKKFLAVACTGAPGSPFAGSPAVPRTTARLRA